MLKRQSCGPSRGSIASADLPLIIGNYLLGAQWNLLGMLFPDGQKLSVSVMFESLILSSVTNSFPAVVNPLFPPCTISSSLKIHGQSAN